MFCKKCGKEINTDASFCPFCGEPVISGGENNDRDGSLTKNSHVKKKLNYKILIIAAAVVLILAFPVRLFIEKSIVKSTAEQYMQLIKTGPGAEEMDRIVVQLLYNTTGSEAVTNLIHGYITGQDVNDIYQALMYHMSYKVKKVDKIGSNHYRITMHVENMDNPRVAAVAWNDFIGRYSELGIIDKVKQAINDLQNDKSETIAAYIKNASDDLFYADYASNMIGGDHTIDVIKENGEWVPVFDEGIEEFIFDCAGFNY